MLAFLASRSIARDNNRDRTAGRSFQTFGVRSDLVTINGVIDEKLVRGCRFASLKPSAIVHHNKCDPPMSHMGLGRVKTKSDLVVMPSGRQIFAFFCSQRDRIAQNSGCGCTA